MKSTANAFLFCLSVCTLAVSVSGATDPQTALEAIQKLRTDRLAEAKAADKRADFAAINAEVSAKAQEAVKGIEPEKVDIGDAKTWVTLFTQAQDYRSARVVAQRWTEATTGEEKFDAQLASMAADYRLKDMRSLAKTLAETKPADAAGAIRLATLANNYVLSALTEADKETAVLVLAAGEAAVPKDGFSNDRQKILAKNTAEKLAQTRKLIEGNPGKEAEALQKSRSEALATAQGG